MGLLFGFLGRVLFGPIGGLIFTLAGSLLFGSKQKSPKIDTIQYQESQYGAPLHYLWGSMRVGGTIFWPHNLKLRPYKIEGEKGGILFFEYQKSPDVYTRQATWGVMFIETPTINGQERPVDVVDKIWMNGKLVYDISEDATDKFRSDSEAMLSLMYSGIRIHLGTSSQSVDPLITADSESSQIAYTNRCYILFVNWLLQDFGDTLPQVNIRAIKRGFKHPDTWTNKTDTGENSLIFHTTEVAFGQLWVMGGILWSSSLSDYYDTGETTGYEIEEGELVAKNQKTLNQARSEHGSAYITGTMNLFGAVAPRLVVLGGMNNIADIYDDPLNGFMMEEKGEAGGWTSCAVISDKYGITLERLPLPRDSFGFCYYERQDGWHPFNRCLIIFCGRNSIGSGNPGHCDYQGPGSALRDAWAWNGGTWYLLTRITEDEGGKESKDCGLGYRLYPASCQHGNTLYAGGGLTVGSDGNTSNARDVYRATFFEADSDFRAIDTQVRFKCICTDILSGISWPDKEHWCLSRLVSYRGQLIASLMYESTTAVYLFKSIDGEGMFWDLWNRGRYKIVGNGAGYYTITGDHSRDFTSDDTITVVSLGLSSNRVSTVSYDAITNLTTINLVASDTASPGYIYLDAISKKDLTNYEMVFDTWDVMDDIQPNDFSITPYEGQLVIIGSNIPEDRTSRNIFLTSPAESELYDIEIGEILTDIHALNGVEEKFTDFSALTQTIHGVAFDKGSGKSRIEVLRQCGLFDLVQIDNKITGVNRGGDPVDTIEADYLGAVAIDGKNETSYQDQAVISFVNPSSVPYRTDVKYFSVELDYQPGIQSSPIRDDATIGKRVITIDLPVAMTDARASQIAEILLYEAAFPSIEIKTPLLYVGCMPTDPITVNTENEQLRVLIESITVDSDDIVAIQGRIEDTTIYESRQVGASSLPHSGPTTETINVTGIFLDLPWFFGENDPSFCFGAYPTDPDDADKFDGVDIYYYDPESSIDYKYLGTVLEYIHHGTVEGILPPGSDYDTLNTLTVTMALGTLASASKDAVLYSGENLVAVGTAENGWEMLSFETAISLGGGQYRLEGLYRHQFGSEHIVHGETDQIVVLNTKRLIKISPGVNGYNIPISYVILPLGGLIGLVVDRPTFTAKYICRKPYSPVMLEGERMPNGDIKIQWFGSGIGTWNDYAEIGRPVIDGVESYEIDVLWGSFAINSIDSITNSFLLVGDHSAEFERGLIINCLGAESFLRTEYYTVSTVSYDGEFTLITVLETVIPLQETSILRIVLLRHSINISETDPNRKPFWIWKPEDLVYIDVYGITVTNYGQNTVFAAIGGIPETITFAIRQMEPTFGAGYESEIVL
jgi:hypothetical protein